MDMECQILLSATPVSYRQTVQVILSTKCLAIALHQTASESEDADKSIFLQNIAAEALAQEDAPLRMIEKVGGSRCCLRFFAVFDVFCSGKKSAEFACWK